MNIIWTFGPDSNHIITPGSLPALAQVPLARWFSRSVIYSHPLLKNVGIDLFNFTVRQRLVLFERVIYPGPLPVDGST